MLHRNQEPPGRFLRYVSRQKKRFTFILIFMRTKTAAGLHRTGPWNTRRILGRTNVPENLRDRFGPNGSQTLAQGAW